jgi:maleylpyruvate isomerase
VKPRHDLSRTLPWLSEGTARFVSLVDDLDDAELGAPSRLPGWTRAHVVGHVARNADALCRLAAWAATGVETPMYPDREARAAEIEATAKLPAPELRADVVASAGRLAEALAGLPADRLDVRVRGATGRELPAAELPWLRVREVWLHGLDLAAGAGPADLPADLVDVLLDDVTAGLAAKPGCAAVLLAPTDRDHEWRLAPGGAEPDTTVTATAAELVTWLTGRHAITGAPALPAWL